MRADEVRLFGRLSVYALAAGTVYWFVSYEPAGTVLLLGFGVATGVAFLALWRAARTAPEAPGSRRADGPFGDDSGPVPTRSAAPVLVGLGIGVVALGAAFGPWFLIAGAVPVLAGAVDWLRAAIRELDLRTATDPPAGGER